MAVRRHRAGGSMITELGAKRAMRVLREAGFLVQEERLPTMAQRWISALNEQGRANLSDSELTAAAERYIAQDHPLHHWPSAGQLEACAIEIRNRTGSKYWAEPEYDHPIATAEDVRKAWEAHLDLDELKRLHNARRGSTEELSA